MTRQTLQTATVIQGPPVCLDFVTNSGRMDIDKEIETLIEAIKKIGTEQNGQIACKFGDLFVETEDTLEALMGTLKAAKKRQVIDYKKQIMFKGADDEQVIILL